MNCYRDPWVNKLAIFLGRNPTIFDLQLVALFRPKMREHLELNGGTENPYTFIPGEMADEQDAILKQDISDFVWDKVVKEKKGSGMNNAMIDGYHPPTESRKDKCDRLLGRDFDELCDLVSQDIDPHLFRAFMELIRDDKINLDNKADQLVIEETKAYLIETLRAQL